MTIKHFVNSQLDMGKTKYKLAQVMGINPASVNYYLDKDKVVISEKVALRIYAAFNVVIEPYTENELKVLRTV